MKIFLKGGEKIMKKVLTVLVISIFFLSHPAYAGDGDLIVDGKVGIGTMNPGCKLTISQTGSGDQQVAEFRNLTGGSTPFITIGTTAPWLSMVFGYNSDGKYGFIGPARYNYGVGTISPQPTKSINIKDNGNVGIGTTSPTSKLQVVGIPEYANNAAALAGGLTAGAFYRTGDLLKVVHELHEYI